MSRYGPIEQAVKDWLATTELADLTRQPGGNPAIHMAMPKTNPIPAVLVTLISGGPVARADLPLTRYRLQFDAIATSRADAWNLTESLMDCLENLGPQGVVMDGVYLGGADVLNVRWLPDPDSDVPRYVLDALITTVL